MPTYPATNLNAATRPLRAPKLTIWGQLLAYKPEPAPQALPPHVEQQLEGYVHLRHCDEHVCTTCGSLKLLNQFYRRKSSSKQHKEGDPIQPCMECKKAYAKQRRKLLKEKNRE